jgi:hypothetical protein
MATQQVTDWVRRFHYQVDPEARVIDCFRVEVWDICMYASDAGASWGDRPVELKQLWAEALRIAKFLQDSFAQRDYRQFGMKNPGDLQPFAYITGCQEERERVKGQVELDLMLARIDKPHPTLNTPADHERRVRRLGDVWDGMQWLEQH